MKHFFQRALTILLAGWLAVSPFTGLAYTKLEKNAAGAEVLNMQLALQSLGYSLNADGKYGAATVKVVKEFQKRYGLSADGVAGDKTLTLLYTLAPAYAPQATALPSPTAAPAYPSYPSSTLTATVVTPSGSLNLRRGASTSAKVITTIPAGDMMIVVSRGTTWTSVIYNGQAGYVMTAFLRFSDQQYIAPPTAAPTPQPTQAPVSPGMAMVLTTGGSLNLRESPSASARILGLLPYGAWVTVNARGVDWSAVSYGGVSGYVMSRYLSFGAAVPTTLPTLAPTPLPTAAPTIAPVYWGSANAYVSTTGGSLNLREAPKSNAKVLTTIPNGTALTVVTQGSAWCAVTYQGIQGYVMTAFLTFPAAYATPAPTQAPIIAPTQAPYPGAAIGMALITTSGGTLNLRQEPSTSARVVLAMPNAASVTVYSRGAVWSEVNYQGTRGYAMTQYLTFLGGAPAAEDHDAGDEDPSAFTRTLKKGMTGADVTWLQNRLAELGYTVNITNLYDDATFAAVKAFQTQNGLDVDGTAGSQTFAVLKSENARKAGASPLTYTTLRIDQSGEGVRQVQTDLKALGYPVTVNGTYDTDTHNAVVAFQQRNGLVISGIADALTRQILHGGGGRPYSTPVETLPANEGWIPGPTVNELKLLHWQNEIKPTVRAGQTFTVFDPNTNLSWKLVFYSLGRHADSQPATWRDTQIMNRSFGSTSWTIHPVYVQLPSGQWTLATMHNRPHLYGSITDNGFGGHLCVHFLRDMAEAQKNDPNYGVNNQVTLRNAWKALTGETVN